MTFKFSADAVQDQGLADEVHRERMEDARATQLPTDFFLDEFRQITLKEGGDPEALSARLTTIARIRDNRGMVAAAWKAIDRLMDDAKSDEETVRVLVSFAVALAVHTGRTAATMRSPGLVDSIPSLVNAFGGAFLDVDDEQHATGTGCLTCITHLYEGYLAAVSDIVDTKAIEGVGRAFSKGQRPDPVHQIRLACDAVSGPDFRLPDDVVQQAVGLREMVAKRRAAN
jgi:hypothetical protein